MYTYTSVAAWFLVCYYAFFALTIGSIVWALVKGWMGALSMITLIITLTLPIVNLLSSIGRDEGLTEIDWLWKELLRGEMWALYVMGGFVYLVVWWCMLIFKSNPLKDVNL
ncbi:hypothetical protein [Bacillus sp. NPDC094106]|uniref:hypothetical protein n=1 Tax=Bacillus sp. NPDC094106 TaxID=3363949 RepID=UPI0037FE3EF4